jgi:uncharacterized Zn finger protein
MEVYTRGTQGEAGVRLYRERGDEIVVYVDGTFGVPSRSEAEVLRNVDLLAGTCECPHQKFRGGICAHMVAVEMKAAERRARRRARRAEASLAERVRHELMGEEERLELAHEIGVRV